jgi:hypothetical protein
MPADDPHIRTFALTSEEQSGSIDYLPYGTRTLKIKVTNPEGNHERLVMRSESLPQGFGETHFFSHEEKTTDFRVTWGGGHKWGSCVLGKDKTKKIGPYELEIPFEECVSLASEQAVPESYVYLNVTHTGGPASAERTLLLSARPADERPPFGPPAYQLKLTLTPPPVTSDPLRCMRDPQASAFHFEGQQVPDYLARWWSPARVSFSDAAPPDLRLTYQGDVLEVGLDDGSSSYRTLARITDSVSRQDIIQPDDAQPTRAFDADLFAFAPGLFALRLWFFWVWKVEEDLIGEEVPDAERFDFLIDTSLQRITFAATDTHWRESWHRASSRKEVVDAGLGLFSSKAIAARLSEAAQKKVQSFFGHVADPADSSPTRPHPYDPVKEQRAELEAAVTRKFVLVPGLEAHVPGLLNTLSAEPEMISSDPRLG